MKIITDIESVVAKEPEFLTAEQLKEATALQLKWQHFQDHRAQFRTDKRDVVAEARRAYAHEPTDENLDKLKAADVDRQLFGNSGLYLDVIQAAETSFIRERLLPWATALIRRALVVAEAELTAVTKRETEHQLEAIGTPPSRIEQNEIIAAASRPVHELKQLLASIKQGASSPALPYNLLPLFGYDWTGDHF